MLSATIFKSIFDFRIFIPNIQDPGPNTAKLHYHLHLTKRRLNDDETSNFSTRADDWCQLQPPRSKTFSWPEDNSGSELCRIRFLSCCLDLPHHHPSHRRTTSPEQWYPAKFSGKCSLTYGCSHVGNIGSEYAKRQFFTLRLQCSESKYGENLMIPSN